MINSELFNVSKAKLLEVEKETKALELINLISFSLPGLKFSRPGQSPRQHLYGDPEHSLELMTALGFADVYQQLLYMDDQEMASQFYNKTLILHLHQSLSDLSTVIYRANYHNLNGQNLGEQICVEFSINGNRILITWMDKSRGNIQIGQILNAYVINSIGEDLGDGWTVPDPRQVFRDREYILGDDEIWLTGRKISCIV